jgi:hypothetical protein
VGIKLLSQQASHKAQLPLVDGERS